MRVNKLQGAQTFDSFFPRALEQDQTLLQYSTPATYNLFRADTENNGSVVATVVNNGDSTITITVVVTWKDGPRSGTRTATTKTMISEYGIHVT
jgi:hypothetical protein